MEGTSLLELLIWTSHNKSGILIPFCLQSQNSISYQNVNYFYQYPFIYSSYYPKEEKKIIQNIYRYIVKNIKKRRFIFLHSKRRKYQVTGTRGQNISTFFPTLRIVSLAIIYSLSIGYHHKMTKKKKFIIDLVLHCICMTVVPCTKVLKDFSSV